MSYQGQQKKEFTYDFKQLGTWEIRPGRNGVLSVMTNKKDNTKSLFVNTQYVDKSGQTKREGGTVIPLTEANGLADKIKIAVTQITAGSSV